MTALSQFNYVSLIGTFGSSKAEQLLALLAKEHDCLGKVGKILTLNREFIDAVFKSNLSDKYKKSILKDFRAKTVQHLRCLNADTKLLSVLENVVRTDYKRRTSLFK